MIRLNKFLNCGVDSLVETSLKQFYDYVSFVMIFRQRYWYTDIDVLLKDFPSIDVVSHFIVSGVELIKKEVATEDLILILTNYIYCENLTDSKRYLLTVLLNLFVGVSKDYSPELMFKLLESMIPYKFRKRILTKEFISDIHYDAFVSVDYK